MKRLLNILVLFLIGQLAHAQIYIKPNNSYGVINNRTRSDSTALYPTGCGAPVGVQGLRGKNEKMSGLYFDSCGHKFYTFDPSDSTWKTPPGAIPIDVYLICGQSNAQGYATTGSNLVTTLPGTVFQWYQGILKAGNDPVGNANVSSAWPQFGKTYYSLTGRRICFVPSAFSGTSQTVAANTGQGTWDTTGTLFDTSIARFKAAMQTLRDSGYTPIFKGVLWHQGENDANAINSATITQAAYSVAFAKMIRRYRDSLGRQTPFYIFRIGVRVSFSDLGYDSVRQAEMDICNFDSLTTMVFYGAKYFPARGLYNADGYHYLQAGYNEMGDIAARNIVSGRVQVLQRNSTAARDVYKDDGGIGLNIGVPLGWLHSVGSTTKPAGIFIGPVGINKTNPTYPLDINDSQRVNSLIISRRGASLAPSIFTPSFLTLLNTNNIVILQSTGATYPELRGAGPSGVDIPYSMVINGLNFVNAGTLKQPLLLTTSHYFGSPAGSIILRPGTNGSNRLVGRVDQTGNDSIYLETVNGGETYVNGKSSFVDRIKMFTHTSAISTDSVLMWSPSDSTFKVRASNLFGGLDASAVAAQIHDSLNNNITFDNSNLGDTIMRPMGDTAIQFKGLIGGNGITLTPGDSTIAISINGNYISSGIYTPTLTNTTNVSASTAYSCQYMRVGNTVTVSGEVDIDPTSGATLTVLTLTLPIAAAVINSNEVAGTAANDDSIGNTARIKSNGSGAAVITYIPNTLTNSNFSFHFTYRIN